MFAIADEYKWQAVREREREREVLKFFFVSYGVFFFPLLYFGVKFLFQRAWHPRMHELGVWFAITLQG